MEHNVTELIKKIIWKQYINSKINLIKEVQKIQEKSNKCLMLGKTPTIKTTHSEKNMKMKTKKYVRAYGNVCIWYKYRNSGQD